ncbi:MAG: hypothetical protein NUV93_08685 [Firmicutes bacterium]|nr:hypothetical protein [Bacillota bacterium]
MRSRFLPAIALAVAVVLSLVSITLVISDRISTSSATGVRRPWDLRGLLNNVLQDLLKTDETRAILRSMIPEMTVDRDALVMDILSAISTSPEARRVLKDALYTPEARQAFADAIRSPEAERAIRDVMASPRVRQTIADLVRESIKQGY